jgi:peptidoglycan/LPS O-acetylase OafA/YrhL
MIAGYIILFTFDWKNLGAQGLSVFGLIANFKMWKLASNYWAPAAHETPLLHTWSLAVEEQFYLLYPLFLITILKFTRRYAFAILLLGVSVSFVIGFYATANYPSAAFYLLPSRAWELAAGCILALLTHKRMGSFEDTKSAPYLSILGAMMIGLSYFCITEERGFPGYQAILPVVGTLLVIAFTSRQNFIGKLLASSPVCYIGKISYSLYLWHWPIIVYAYIIKEQTEYSIPFYIIVSLILLLSIGSYHLIEKPIRFRKHWALPVFLLTITSIVASATMFLWRVKYDLSSFSPVAWNGRLYDVTPTQKPWEGFMKERMTDIHAPLRENHISNEFRELGIFKPYGGPRPEIMVLGDSHALMWSSTIDTICRELGRSVSFFAADGTSPSISLPPQKVATRFFSAEEKQQFDAARIRVLNEKKPKLVILSCKYSGVKDTREIINLLNLISKSGSKCLIIEQPPILPIGDKNALIYCAEILRKNKKIDLITLPFGEVAEWKARKSMINKAVEKFSNTYLVEISDLYLNHENQIILQKDKVVNYIDDDHLSDAGAAVAKKRIMKIIQEIVTK